MLEMPFVAAHLGC